jgi:flagellar biosynthesis protein FlhB
MPKQNRKIKAKAKSEYLKKTYPLCFLLIAVKLLNPVMSNKYQFSIKALNTSISLL